MSAVTALRYFRARKWTIARFNAAVRSGAIKRPGNCESCGVECTPDGHHEDYSKPREVKWLCHRCHVEAHRVLRAEAKQQRRELRRQAKLAARQAETERIIEAWERLGECKGKRTAQIINRYLVKKGQFRCYECQQALPLELKQKGNVSKRCKACASAESTRRYYEFKARDPEGCRAEKKYYNDLAQQKKKTERNRIRLDNRRERPEAA